MTSQEAKILKEARNLWQKLADEENKHLKRIFGKQGGEGSMPAIIPAASTDAYHLFRKLCDLFDVKPGASIDEIAYQYGKIKGNEEKR